MLPSLHVWGRGAAGVPCEYKDGTPNKVHQPHPNPDDDNPNKIVTKMRTGSMHRPLSGGICSTYEEGTQGMV